MLVTSAFFILLTDNVCFSASNNKESSPAPKAKMRSFLRFFRLIPPNPLLRSTSGATQSSLGEEAKLVKRIY